MKDYSNYIRRMEENVILGEKVRNTLLEFLVWTHIASIAGFLLGLFGLSGEEEILKKRKEKINMKKNT